MAAVRKGNREETPAWVLESCKKIAESKKSPYAGSLRRKAERRELEACTTSKIPMTHRGLCELARRWLLRNSSGESLLKQGGHCKKAFSEIQAGWWGEQADAFGLNSCFSVLIEVKMSVSDFRADANKEHRRRPGLGIGDYRYYMAPEGILKPEFIPEKWGLIEVTDRRQCRVVRGYAADQRNPQNWQFDANLRAERCLLLWDMCRSS